MSPLRVVYLRRKAKHLASQGTRTALCGYEVPERDRWRIRPLVRWPTYVSCYRCRTIGDTGEDGT